jgi:hypothetical protein
MTAERRDLITYLVRAQRKRHTRLKGKKNRASKIPNRLIYASVRRRTQAMGKSIRWYPGTVRVVCRCW